MPVRKTTASRSVFDGIVPVFVQTPPSVSRRSITATRRPSLAAWMAARWPPGPEPMTSEVVVELHAWVIGGGRRGLTRTWPTAALSSCAVAEYRITSWREIPTMVTARDAAGATAKVALPDRFQEAVDEAAMRQGLVGSDAYLEAWVQGEWLEADGPPDEVAARVAAELDEAHPPERLASMLDP